jgi:hypothetical protein
MPDVEYIIMMAVGAGFAVLGLIGILWGRHEEKNYFDSLAARSDDVREFMEHWPERPQPGALRTGGWIAVLAGLLVLLGGIILWLLNVPLS